MGITGLLPFIKNSCRSANVRDFPNATVAIDAYSWLHKGAFSCAEKLVKGEKTDGYIFYCAKLLNMLLDLGVKPIMVFDGCNLSSKKITEDKRREIREKTRQKGKELLCEGKVKEARECFQRCVDVTPEMAYEVIQMCRKKNVDCIVAPYEADAQLAYLDKIGMAQIIITEDSDLVLFGCNKILFKMDSFGGGLLYEKENLPKSFSANASRFSFEKFQYMCILSGCDYLPSLPGIGLAKACKFFMLTTNPDVTVILKKLPSYLKMPKLDVSDEYIDSFVKAYNTFLYQLVFCPQKKILVPLNPYPLGMTADDMEYAGKYLPDDIAIELALGNINVKTLKKFKSTINEGLSVDLKRSMIWGTKPDLIENKCVKKAESVAFKFNSHKVKGVKRKVESYVTQSKAMDQMTTKEDDELFSMYCSFNSNDDNVEKCEEDPLAITPDKKPKLSFLSSSAKSEIDSPSVFSENSKLSLKRVVKSKFFVSKTANLENCSVLRENSPENLVNKSDISPSKCKEVVENNNMLDVIQHPEVQSLIKSDKENIIHRFAKKKIESDSSNVTSSDITNSLNKVKRSWLDIIDTESSATTSTISSCGITEKMISVDAEDSVVSKSISESNFVKVKKTNLKSTKILDFKWDKESCNNKLNTSLRSDGNSTYESIADSEDDIDIELNTSKSDACSLVNNINNIAICDISKVCIANEDSYDLPSSSGGSINSTVFCSQNSLNEALNLKQPNANFKIKQSKCRQLGLSKKSKNSEKKLSIKETLMNFNFVRKPRCKMPFTT